MVGGIREVSWRDFESDLHSHCFELVRRRIGVRITEWEWKCAMREFVRVQHAGCEPGVLVLLGAVLAEIDKREGCDEQ